MERQSIHQLSPSLVNRIAAGEVIERPASIVKELVENSIDAGATHIIVEVEDGGRELIRVIDDGSGIPAEELSLAFASHATSKLQSDDDLFAINTMGFRGEALASIGAVSHARICSRPAVGGDGFAHEIYNRGGVISEPQAAAGNVGTTIEIRNVFFNTPARRKFLKGSPTEFGYISEALLRTALPQPGVSFKLLHNGKVTLDLPATTEQDRLLAAWPAEFRDQRLPIESRDAEVKLRGIIGLPELARPTQKYQHIYLNGRPIRDKFIQHAVRESYRGLTEPGRYPAAILLLTVPPQDVDVNVHPTKSEVRFRDSGRIHGLVMAVVREKLMASDLAPVAIPMRTDVEDRERADMQARLAAFFKNPTSAPEAPFVNNPIIAPVQHSTFSTQQSTSNSIPAAPQDYSRMSSSIDLGSAKPQAAIQLHNSYLVAQSEDGLVIIDQHALHERIMFEELIARVTRGPLESQRLLIPITLPASSRQVALLDQIQALLQRLGIEISSFGPETIAIQAFPSFLEKLDPADFVRELLERGEQELLDLHEEELLHEILDMMACKAAVKAGDPLTQAEIEALLARRELVERSSNCPHGRPTTLRMSLRDLEKQFKRTGF
ncbi:MAG TPA: DNA mismatch repair endonuclease MutL [Tepidisphaeraceae bacterium]|jgi:DNA mismatch repair protein MutL|nr:DNA mismatch repair endonuclease MutL [Tepidisphaeraceae bacterium]